MSYRFHAPDDCIGAGGSTEVDAASPPADQHNLEGGLRAGSASVEEVPVVSSVRVAVGA